MPDITPHQKPLVLIVDDMPDNVEILGEALTEDYEIQFAMSGEEALKLVRTHTPDLILLDIMMPGIDGLQVCKILKANAATRDIPIIFVTAQTAADKECKGLDIGAVDYITKPFNTPIVRRRVRNHIQLKQRADLLESFASIDALTHLPNRRRFDEQ